MESLGTGLQALKQEDYLLSFDLKKVYLHVPIHPVSRKYLVCFEGTALPISIIGFWPFHIAHGVLTGDGTLIALGLSMSGGVPVFKTKIH